MRNFCLTSKMVAFYCNKTDRAVRKMCERGSISAVLFGGDWLISAAELKRKYYKMGRQFWKNICFDFYRDKAEANAAFQEFLDIEAEEIQKEKERKKNV